MKIQHYNMNGVTENKAMDIISKVGSLVMVGDIGATRTEVANFFGISSKTLSRVIKLSSKDLLAYGNYVKSGSEIRSRVGDKSVHHKTKEMYLFNRKHIMLFACHLGSSSEIAKKILHYLIQVESNASKEDKVTAALEQLAKWYDLPNEIHHSVYLNALNAVKESKELVSFAESIGHSNTLISINDFAKSTYETLGLGQRRLFKEMRINRILNHQNKPYQYYINMGYFKVVTKVINNKIIYQTKITGKGQFWLLNKMRKILGV